MADQVVPFRDGESVLFDDTAPRAAWNHGSADRVTQFCDLPRPVPAPRSWANGTLQRVLAMDGRYRHAPDRAAARDAALEVVRHPVNQGVGPAIRTGLSRARGRFVFYTDADLPVDLAVLPELLAPRERTGADIVTGYRRSRRHESLRRRLYGATYNVLVRVLFGLRVRDVNFEAKLMTVEVLTALPLRSESIFIDAEILARADRSGTRIVECPLDYELRRAGESSTPSLRHIRSLLREMRVLGPDIRRGR